MTSVISSCHYHINKHWMKKDTLFPFSSFPKIQARTYTHTLSDRNMLTHLADGLRLGRNTSPSQERLRIQNDLDRSAKLSGKVQVEWQDEIQEGCVQCADRSDQDRSQPNQAKKKKKSKKISSCRLFCLLQAGMNEEKHVFEEKVKFILLWMHEAIYMLF